MHVHFETSRKSIETLYTGTTVYPNVFETVAKQLNPQIIGEIGDGPTYSINREEVEVVCQIPSGPVDGDEDTSVRRPSTRGDEVERTNESWQAVGRTKTVKRQGTRAKAKVHPDTARRARHPVENSKMRAVFLEPTRATVGYNVVMYLGEP